MLGRLAGYRLGYLGPPVWLFQKVSPELAHVTGV